MGGEMGSGWLGGSRPGGQRSPGGVALVYHLLRGLRWVAGLIGLIRRMGPIGPIGRI